MRSLLFLVFALVVAWAARFVPVRTSTVNELDAKVAALEAALAGDDAPTLPDKPGVFDSSGPQALLCGVPLDLDGQG